MTNSIYDKMTLTKENEKPLKYGVSKKYLKKVKASDEKRDRRKSIINKPISKEIKKYLLDL